MIKPLIALLPLLALGGCGSSSSTAGINPADLEAYNKQRNLDPAKTKRFLDQLATTAPDERRAFVNQHPDEMRDLAQTQDPALQARFQQIVRGIK